MSEPTLETAIADEESTSDDAKPFLSQKDYNPTPYRDSSWERVGIPLESLGFLPLKLGVVKTKQFASDPMFESFDSTTRPDAGELFHAPGDAHYTGARPKEVEEVQGAALDPAELEKKYSEGYEAGLLEGEARAKEKMSEYYEQLRLRQDALHSALTSESQSVFARVEKEAVRLALEVARRILAVTSQANPEYIIEVVRGAVAALGAAKPIKIRISPEDHEFIKIIGMPAELSAEELGIVYEADDSIRSGCVVETDFGEIDMQLDTMWEQVKDQLCEVYK